MRISANLPAERHSIDSVVVPTDCSHEAVNVTQDMLVEHAGLVNDYDVGVAKFFSKRGLIVYVERCLVVNVISNAETTVESGSIQK